MRAPELSAMRAPELSAMGCCWALDFVALDHGKDGAGLGIEVANRARLDAGVRVSAAVPRAPVLSRLKEWLRVWHAVASAASCVARRRAVTLCVVVLRVVVLRVVVRAAMRRVVGQSAVGRVVAEQDARLVVVVHVL
eukprot:2341492-Pleurochrysis_carterae.AAC.2